MICKNCGKENDENSMYCEKCNEPLNEKDPPLPILMDIINGK